MGNQRCCCLSVLMSTLPLLVFGLLPPSSFGHAIGALEKMSADHETANDAANGAACGPIELVLYGIETLRPTILGKPLLIDQMFGLKHAGILVCGIEFHYGYENLISTCESPEPGSNNITCTNEMNPQFDVEPTGGRVRIRQQHYLKSGRIVPNLKTRRSQNERQLSLHDIEGNGMRTTLNRQQIVQTVLNGMLRNGQQDFPRVELLDNDGKQFRVYGNSIDEVFQLPDGIDLHTWNEHVVAHTNLLKVKNARNRDASGQPEGLSNRGIKLYEQLMELQAKFNANATQQQQHQGGRFSNNKKNEVGNELEGEPMNETSGGSETDAGRFKYSNYGKVMNNCVDFAVHFMTAISPGQQCNWPAVMRQLKAIQAFRFVHGMWINGLKILSEVPRMQKQVAEKLTNIGQEGSIEEFLSAEDNSLPDEAEEYDDAEEEDLSEYEEMDKCLGVGIVNGKHQTSKRAMIKKLLSIGMVISVLSMYPLMHKCLMPSAAPTASNAIGEFVPMLMGARNHGWPIPPGHGNHQIWHD